MKRTIGGITALALAALAAVGAAAPAHADDDRWGHRSCSSLVRITSTTSNPGGGSFAVVHGIGGLTWPWESPGYHTNISHVYSGNWVVTTSGLISSASGTCSGAS